MSARPPVLVDSSVWVDFYRPDGSEAARSAVVEALEQERVVTLPLIVTEVVRGAPDEEELERLAGDFEGYVCYPSTLDTGLRAARIGWALRRRGRPVPATDLIIAAAAIEHGCELWHRDDHFRLVAEVAPLDQRSF